MWYVAPVSNLFEDEFVGDEFAYCPLPLVFLRERRLNSRIAVGTGASGGPKFRVQGRNGIADGTRSPRAPQPLLCGRH